MCVCIYIYIVCIYGLHLPRISNYNNTWGKGSELFNKYISVSKNYFLKLYFIFYFHKFRVFRVLKC